jgi:hypothetical protein
MKRHIIYLLAAGLLLAGCERGIDEVPTPDGGKNHTGQPAQGADVPEGWFVATFGASTRALTPTVGEDSRVGHISYIVFDKATEDFVKRRVVTLPAGPVTWPLNAPVRDTLPDGEYTVVFLGNATDGVAAQYEGGYDATRLRMPASGFGPASELYKGEVTISNLAPTGQIWLQRITSRVDLHRNSIDAQQALDTLVNNIFENLKADSLIAKQLDGVLRLPLTKAVTDNTGVIGIALGLVGGVDAAVNLLIPPIIDVILEPLVEEVVHQAGGLLTGNQDHAALIEYLGFLVNPWEFDEDGFAIVSINDFPGEVDLGLNVTGSYTGLNRFAMELAGTDDLAKQKSVFIRGFGNAGSWDIQEVNIVKGGLLPGLVVDEILDDWLLPGGFVDIEDPVSVPSGANVRYMNNYSLVDIGLKDYTQGNVPLDLTLNVGSILNTLGVDAIVSGIPLLGPLLSLLVDLIDPIITDLLRLVLNLTAPFEINLPLLGIDNLSVEAGWGDNTRY